MRVTSNRYHTLAVILILILTRLPALCPLTSALYPMPKSSASPLLPNLTRAQQLVLELMAIPGKSGEEEQVAQFIRQKLLSAGARP